MRESVGLFVGMIEGLVGVYDCLRIFHDIEKNKSSYQNA